MEDEYIAVVGIEERDNHSLPTFRSEMIRLLVPEGEDPESKLEEFLNEEYLLKSNHRITEITPSIIYKIKEKIIPKKKKYETHLKKMYESNIEYIEKKFD